MRADAARVGRLLKTARGQIDGVLRMIEADQYCVDISRQIMAAEAVLHRANHEVLKAHLEGCVEEAFSAGSDEEKSEKIAEIASLLQDLSR